MNADYAACMGSGFAATALGTIRESSSSWGSVTQLQTAATEADSALATSADGDHVPAPEDVMQSADTEPAHLHRQTSQTDAALHSPSDTGSETARSVQLSSDLKNPDSSPASSVMSDMVSEAESSAGLGAIHVTGTACMFIS